MYELRKMADISSVGGEEEQQDYNLMKVTELRDTLANRGLSTAGKKSDLIVRLLQDDDSAAARSSSVSMPPAAAAASSLAACCAADGTSTAAIAPASLELATTASDQTAALLLLEEQQQAATQVSQGDAGGVGLRMTAPVAHAAAHSPSVTAAAAALPAAYLKADAKTLTEEERRQLRKAKFGLKSDEEKKLERARRFGLSVPELEEEKKVLRAQRFGTVTAESHQNIFQGDAAEATKRQKRAERFGISTEAEKKRKRAERFGMVSEEEKLERRLQRFGVGGNVAPAAATDTAVAALTAASSAGLPSVKVSGS